MKIPGFCTSRHVFGSLCGSNLRDPVLFADSTGQQIAFPVGRQLALRHVENNETSFLTTSERRDMINASKPVVVKTYDTEKHITVHDHKRQ